MSFYMLDNPNPYTPQGVFPRRGGYRPSGTCIIHTSESVLDVIGPDSTAEDCAAFIARRTDYGCYHDLVDSDSIIEMYPFEWETWQDSETNNWAVGLSCACKTTDWATMGDVKRDKFLWNLAICAADFVTYMKVQYGVIVPLKRISGEEARAGVPGFCAHGDSGINRSDPGRDFRWDIFFDFTQRILNGAQKEVDEVTPEQMFELKVFFQTVLNQRSGEIVNEVRVNTAHQASRILDVLNTLDDIPEALVNELKAEIEEIGNAGVEEVMAKFKDMKITLGVTDTL